MRQVFALLRIQLAEFRSRLRMAIGVVATVTLTVIVLSAFMALASGLRAVEQGAADPALFYIVSKGARMEAGSTIVQQELGDITRVVTAVSGIASLAPETVQLVRLDDDPQSPPAVLRGFARGAFALRPDCRLTTGRMFSPGAAQVIVGEGRSAALGQVVRLGTARLTVVGRFRCVSTARNQEIWGDAGAFQRLADLPLGWNLAPLRIDQPTAERLKAALGQALSGRYTLVSERTLLAPQTASTRALIRVGWPLAIGVCVGAIVSCVAAMDFAVSSSRRRIATLKAIGFRTSPIFLAMLTEAAVVASAGAVLGFAIAVGAFSFLSVQAVGADSTTTAVPLRLTISDFTMALAAGAALGIVGGFVPSLRGARTSPQSVR